MRTRPRASDHRALALEEVATSPTEPSINKVCSSLASSEFASDLVYKMVYQLLQEGLIGRREDGELFITQTGLDYLTHARFDLPIPEPRRPRPGARKKQKTKEVVITHNLLYKDAE